MLRCSGEPCWENGGTLPFFLLFFFFCAGERFPGCVMGKDANMQTLSGIVPAQGEKLKHKSGGGKLRGGRLFKGGWLARGSRLPLAREPPFPGQHFQRVSKASGWGKAYVRRGASGQFPRGRATARESPPGVAASGQRRVGPPVGSPASRSLRSEGCFGLSPAETTRAGGVLGEGTPSPRGPGWNGEGGQRLASKLCRHTRGGGGSALGGGDFSSYLSFIARDRVGAEASGWEAR